MLKVEADGIVFKEGDMFVSYCPKLDVSSCGSTIDEARKGLRTAVSLFLEEAEKMGTLEEILEESGFELNASNRWEAPRIVATELMQLA